MTMKIATNQKAKKIVHNNLFKYTNYILYIMFTSGYCVDLETTIASKIPDHIRPKGQKRLETRIIEIGAAHVTKNRQWGCLVNPLPRDVVLKTPEDLFALLRSMYQKPDTTINFWSSVLVKRKSLRADMFLHNEPPMVWSNRTTFNRAKDFVRWHNNPAIGPLFVSETRALKQLLAFTKDEPIWYAHNGRSFDFKVLKGCAQRCGLSYSVKEIDTLYEFRKCLPGHKSYSQPVLYKALFNQRYNAHVAIDDALALKRICAHALGGRTDDAVPQTKTIKLPTSPITVKRRMNLTFKAGLTDAPRHWAVPVLKLRAVPVLKLRAVPVLKLRGVGPKTSQALAEVNIFTVKQFKAHYDKNGVQWLRKILPNGVRWRVVAHSISSCIL